MPRSPMRTSSKKCSSWNKSQGGTLTISVLTRHGRKGGSDFQLVEAIDEDYQAIAVGKVNGPSDRLGELAPRVQGLLLAQLRCYLGPDPKHTLAGLNAILLDELPVDHFVTLVLGILHRPSGALRLVRAGGSPLLLRARGSEVTVPESEGIALGLDPGLIFRKSLSEVRIVFRDGETLLLHSDGLTQAAKASGEGFGLQRLVAELNTVPENIATGTLSDTILAGWDQFLAGEEPQDDATLICLGHRSPGN